MPRRQKDKFVHLRLSEEMQTALGIIAESIQANPDVRHLLMTRSGGLPQTRVVQWCIARALSECEREAA